MTWIWSPRIWTRRAARAGTHWARALVRWLNQRGPEQPILEVLAAHAAGADRLAELARVHRDRPDEMERCLVEMLPCVTGSACERLSRLAAGLGIFGRWQEQARSHDPRERGQAVTRLTDFSWGVADSVVMLALADKDESIRTQAWRALLRSGGRRDIERVFALAIAQRMAVRSVLAGELAQHALTLAETAIPSALRSRDPETIMAVLELIEGWAKALPLACLPPLLGHCEARVRARALRALPYASNVRSLEAEVMGALRDASAEVRAAACFAAARLRIEPAVPAIVECLRGPEPELVRDAAFALAELGQEGLRALEKEVGSGWSPGTAAAALEAMERLRTERYGYVRL